MKQMMMCAIAVVLVAGCAPDLAEDEDLEEIGQLQQGLSTTQQAETFTNAVVVSDSSAVGGKAARLSSGSIQRSLLGTFSGGTLRSLRVRAKSRSCNGDRPLLQVQVWSHPVKTVGGESKLLMSYYIDKSNTSYENHYYYKTVQTGSGAYVKIIHKNPNSCNRYATIDEVQLTYD